MKIYIDPNYVEPENKFGKSFPLEAELTEELIEECGLKEGLQKFGRMLAEQMKNDYKFRDSKAVVVGIEIHEIDFQLLLEHPEEKRRYA